MEATSLEKRLAKFHAPHIFLNKVLSEHSHTHSVTFYSCFQATMYCNDLAKKTVKYLPFGPLSKKFANIRFRIATELEMRELDSIPISYFVCMNY